jgi:hypothetical protein
VVEAEAEAVEHPGAPVVQEAVVADAKKISSNAIIMNRKTVKTPKRIQVFCRLSAK